MAVQVPTLLDLCRLQHGVVTRGQLLQGGWRRGAVEHALGCGRLHAIHRGVYAVGRPDLTDHGLWLAAVFAAGPTAVLSHRSAAALWGIRPWPARLVEVSGPGRTRRRGVIAHRSEVPERERTSVHGIPVTTVPRTLLDLGEVVPRVELDETVHQAHRLGRFDAEAVQRTIDAHPGRNGAARLRAVTAETQPGKGFVRSKLERWLRELCRVRSLPVPESNQTIGGLEVDFLWRDQQLIVEADGRGSHLTPQAFERDHKRDRKLKLAGYQVLRFTYREITETPDLVAADILAALRSAS